MPRKAACAIDTCPAYPNIRFIPITHTEKTAYSPKSVRVEFARPNGKTTRNATKQTVDMTRTAVPFLLALGMRRFAPRTPARTSTHSHMTGVNSDLPMGNHTRNAIASVKPAIRSGDRTPRSSDLALVRSRSSTI